MHFRYRILPVAQLVRIDYLGQPDFAEWAAMMCAIFADPSYEPGFGFLVDRSPVVEAPSIAHIRQVSDFLVEHRVQLRGSRRAVVVSSTASYGMARMLGARIGVAGLEQAVFTDPAEALAWLTTGRAPE